MVLSGPIEQPCLRLLKPEEDGTKTSRHQVCTFCIAHKKSPVSISNNVLRPQGSQ